VNGSPTSAPAAPTDPDDTAPTDPPGMSSGSWTAVRSFLAPSRVMISDAWAFLGDVVRKPAYSRLRWVLLVGFLVQLALAPLTSWGYDTPGFVQDADYTLFTGNPYSSGLWFNPPLGPYVAVPFTAVWNWISGGAAPVMAYPGFYTLSEVGTLGTLVPSPGALLAWKLPLIVANVVTALGLVALLRDRPGLAWSPAWIAGAWILNPLVIWATAIHGEVDALAVALVVCGLIALGRERWIISGGLIGLAVMAKAYPLAMLPAIAVFFATAITPALASRRDRLLAGIGFFAGLAIAVLPFYSEYAQFQTILSGKYSVPVYGALSVTVIFNQAVPKGWGPYHTYVSHSSNGLMFTQGFEALALLAVLAGSAFLAYRLFRSQATQETPPVFWVTLESSWALVGVLLTDPSPEAENLLDLISLMIIVLPLFAGRRMRRLIGGLSLAGLAQYWSLATPVAVFTPLAVMIGPGAISFVSQVASEYIESVQRGWIWLGIGLFGGSVMIATFVITGLRLLPKGFFRRLYRRLVRPRSEVRDA
jgi:hypothetical protein